ncbi:hypothetical protein GCM10022254_09930 [Actinomadura meridiana]|uniref:Uncharacterized protein n=1 Tax=Actinomadura meridiana TaxID=559626 RepID=A0ABP8BU08_9ACTN
MTIAVDFDGVIHAYSRGWQDGTIYDEPVPGAVDALHALMGQYAVFIHTSRDPEQVVPWLEGLGFDVTADDPCVRCQGAGGLAEPDDDDPVPGGMYVEDPCRDCEGSGYLRFWNERGRLLVTDRKLPAVAYVDDRAIRFTTWRDAFAQLHSIQGANSA